MKKNFTGSRKLFCKIRRQYSKTTWFECIVMDYSFDTIFFYFNCFYYFTSFFHLLKRIKIKIDINNIVV